MDVERKFLGNFMASRGDQWLLEGVGGQGGAPALWSLDQSLEYLREHFVSAVWRYMLAMLPFTLAMIFITQAVATGRRADVNVLCVVLTAATVWRWIGLAFMQRQIQIDIAGPRAVPIRAVIPSIVCARAICNFAITFGVLIIVLVFRGYSPLILMVPFLIVPATFGMFLSVIAAPLYLSGEWASPPAPSAPAATAAPLSAPPPVLKPARIGPTISNAIEWIWRAKGRLWRMSWALTIGSLLVGLLTLAFQAAVSSSTLADWFGLDAAKTRVIVNSVGWLILSSYLQFILFDLYFHIVGVFLFYDLQARRLGSDLFARLESLQATKGAH